MQQEFPLAPLGRFALFGLWLPLLATLAFILGAAWMQPREAVPAGWLFALPLVLLLGAGLSVALRRRRITLDNRQLRVVATFYRKQLAVEDIDLANARVVNLDEHTELRPMLKTNGFQLPGFSAGHYRLRNLSKAFCLVTDRNRVLLLPLRDGGQLLLSPENPRALLDRLRELARTTTRG